MSIRAFVVASLAVAACVPVFANAAPQNKEPGVSVLSGQDFSARRRHHRYYGYYSPGYGYGSYAADPAWQAPIARQGRAMGRCVVDDGYGRFHFCD
ncbi:MAG: hypothetical protein JO205_01740 [Pseudolabrys sp.]|nr:hypothetical protein [Pseudolabrys sp.]